MKSYFNSTTALSANLNNASNNIVTSKLSTDSTVSSVHFYEKIRWLVTMALLSIPAALIILLLYGTIRSTPIAMKRHVIATIPIWALIHLIAIALFISAIVFGDTCTYVIQNRQPQALKFATMNTGFNFTSILGAKDSCNNGSSLLNVAFNLGYTNSSTSVNSAFNSLLIDADFNSPLSRINAQ